MAVSPVLTQKTCGAVACSLILLLAAFTSASAADRPSAAGSNPIVFTAAAVAPHAPGADDASLDHLLTEALQNNPEVRAARKEHEAALHRISPAGALDDPTIEMGILNLPVSSFNFSREDMTMKMLGLTQRLPYPGKRALKRDVAQLDSESAAFAYSETVNRVIRNTRVAYYDFAVVTASMRLIDQN